jgi:hypothetical protein
MIPCGIPSEDLREMSRRLEEVMFIAERGYDPVYVDERIFGKPLWIKCHWGSVHTHAGAVGPPREGEGAAADA